jgi:ABC-type taurine transport system substrate-binding protein
MVNTISDAGFFVAEAKGYFKAAGIEVKFQPFSSASGMIAPLASGELDVGSGAVSAGHYNANERQIPLKFVADKARNAPDLSFQSIVVRSALMESGKFKSFADLNGLKFAIPAPASVGEQSILNEALQRGGLGWNDCERAFLGINEQVAAFRNGGLDASVTSEPLISIMAKQGLIQRFATVGSFYPNQQAAVVCYGAQFATKRPDVGRRFMKAYLQGVRDYNDALANGRIAGPNADEIRRLHCPVLGDQGPRPDQVGHPRRAPPRRGAQCGGPRQGPRLREVLGAGQRWPVGRRRGRHVICEGGGGRARPLPEEGLSAPRARLSADPARLASGCGNCAGQAGDSSRNIAAIHAIIRIGDAGCRGISAGEF